MQSVRGTHQQQIKRLLEEYGLTQERLAKRSGMTDTLARLEFGMHDPSFSTLAKLAKALKVPVA